MRIKNNIEGFTLVELMIATSVFSIILLVASVGVVNVGRLYFKGVISSKTQETSRSVNERISRSIQLSNDDVAGPFNATIDAEQYRYYCIGSDRYTFAIDSQLGSDPGQSLWQDTINTSGCPVPTDFNNGNELLSDNMRLLNLNISEENAGSGIWNITVNVAYGDDDLLSHYDDDSNLVGAPETANCKLGISGSSFCAVSELSTTIVRRIQQ